MGGAVGLGSRFYVLHEADEESGAAVARRDSIVLVKGARQVGKTSVLARGLQRARESDARSPAAAAVPVGIPLAWGDNFCG